MTLKTEANRTTFNRTTIAFGLNTTVLKIKSAFEEPACTSSKFAPGEFDDLGN